MSAAFFDVDGTLLKVKSMLAFYYFYVSEYEATSHQRAHRIQYFEHYVGTNSHLTRMQLNKWYYSLFAGDRLDALEATAECWFSNLQPKDWFDDTVEILKHHQQSGVKIVLVSGSGNFILKPLQRYLDVPYCLCSNVEVKNNLLTGKLNGQPMIGSNKLTAIKHWLQHHNIDSQDCFAYGDHISDADMLGHVGFPVAVNPDQYLFKLAQDNGWNIHNTNRHSPLPTPERSVC